MFLQISSKKIEYFIQSLPQRRISMQTTFQIMIIALTFMLVINGLYKSIDDWIRMRELCEEEEIGNLRELIKSTRGWISRHLLCAFFGVILVTAIKLTPALEEFDLLAALFAAHIVFSLLFAFTESLFAQRISNAVDVRTAPARIPSGPSGRNFPPEGENA